MDKQLKAYYVTSEIYSQFLTSFENYPPQTFVEWIIILDEAFHIEFRVTWLECGECNQALTACDQALEVSLVHCAWCNLILLSQESNSGASFGRIRSRLKVEHFPSFTIDILFF